MNINVCVVDKANSSGAVKQVENVSAVVHSKQRQADSQPLNNNNVAGAAVNSAYYSSCFFFTCKPCNYIKCEFL